MIELRKRKLEVMRFTGKALRHGNAQIKKKREKNVNKQIHAFTRPRGENGAFLKKDSIEYKVLKFEWRIDNFCKRSFFNKLWMGVFSRANQA